MEFNLKDHYKKQIDELKNNKLISVVDIDKWEATVINSKGEDITPLAFRLLLSLLQEKEKQIKEMIYGEPRKYPLDEFTKKRFGIMDYVLLVDKSTENFREVFEAFHDENGIFTMDSFYIDLKKNYKSYESGFTVHLTYDDAKALLEPLQKFVIGEEENRNNR